jgi:hypothetical protein
MSEEIHYVEYFTGGVPPKVIFQMDLEDMRDIAARGPRRRRQTQEVELEQQNFVLLESSRTLKRSLRTSSQPSGTSARPYSGRLLRNATKQPFVSGIYVGFLGFLSLDWARCFPRSMTSAHQGP